jgi:tetratricopeptide (TPR) repeat protein
MVASTCGFSVCIAVSDSHVPLSLGIALLLAILLARSRHWKTVLVVVALLFGVRTAIRNLDWLDEERSIISIARTSPNNSVAQFNLGMLRLLKGDQEGALEAYDRALDLDAFNRRAACEKAGLLWLNLGRLAKSPEAAVHHYADFRAAYRSCEYLTHNFTEWIDPSGHQNPPPDEVRAYIDGK